MCIIYVKLCIVKAIENGGSIMNTKSIFWMLGACMFFSHHSHASGTETITSEPRTATKENSGSGMQLQINNSADNELPLLKEALNKKKLSPEKGTLSDYAYEMGILGNHFLYENNFEMAAEAYLASLVAQYENYDLLEFCKEIGVDLRAFPDVLSESLLKSDARSFGDCFKEFSKKLENFKK